MENPVRRLIAGASLLACAAANLAGAQEIGLRRPIIGAAVLRPDTVWFCGTVLGADRVSYYFVRQARAWGEAVAPRVAPCSDAGMRMFGDDSVTDAGQGVRVVRVPAARAADDNRALGRAYLRVVDSARGRTTEPLRRLDPATIAKLPKFGGDLEVDSVSTGVGGTAVDDSTIWVGLRGGFPEGEGTYGGLLRIDRRSSRVAWVRDSLIVWREITGIVDAGRSLLVAAVTDAEYGPLPEPGLLRFSKADSAWHPYGDVGLPDNLIRLMAGSGRLVAFATEHGLAVVDLGADGALSQWSNVWFVPRLVGDSMVYGLGPKDRAPETELAEAPWIFAQRFAAVGHERFYHDALSALPPSRVHAAVFGPGEDSVVIALADTSLMPLLTRMLTQQESQRVAALALARLGVRSPAGATDSLRRQFLAGGYNRTALAKALFAAGDSMPRDWARAVLDSAVRTGARDRTNKTMNAVEILSDLRDRASMGLVIAIASTADPTTSNFLAARLAAFDDPIAWGTMLSLERAGKFKAFDVVMALRPSALTDSVVHERVRDLLRGALPVDSLRQAALIAVDRLRMIELAPEIIDRIAVPVRPGVPAGFNEVRVLVSLSGRSDAPIWTGLAPPPEVHDWWQRWWASTSTATAASADASRQAQREWMGRFFAARPR